MDYQEVSMKQMNQQKKMLERQHYQIKGPSRHLQRSQLNINLIPSQLYQQSLRRHSPFSVNVAVHLSLELVSLAKFRRWYMFRNSELHPFLKLKDQEFPREISYLINQPPFSYNNAKTWAKLLEPYSLEVFLKLKKWME